MNEENKIKKTKQIDALNEDHGDPRVYLAAERTLLAWIRTGLAMMGFGFVVARFGFFLREIAGTQHLEPSQSYIVSLCIGTGLIILGVVVNTLAAVQHRYLVQIPCEEKFHQHFHPLFAITIALVLAVIGIIMTYYLLAM